MSRLEDGGSAVIGQSHLKSDIICQRYGSGKLNVLLLGGVHGDEPEGYHLADKFSSELQNGNIQLSSGVSLYLTTRLNVDGCAVNRRTNHHNVDLNRNLPTRDWQGGFENVRYYPGAHAGSEPENQALLKLISEEKIQAIISLHSYENPMINYNGECENWAEAMSKLNGLPPKGDIGYPTPGSLGTYAGWERNLPTITLEILRDQASDAVWEKHRDGLIGAINYYTEHPVPPIKIVS